MDQRSAEYIINDPTANRTHNYFLKRTLQFLVPISVISFLVSYFSHPLHFYSSIIPFLNQALDRKCMFLICNGILAFLANSLKLSGSALDHEEDGFVFRGNDCAQLDDAAVVEEMEMEVQHEEDDVGAPPNLAEEIEREEWEEEGDDDDDDEVESSPSVMVEEVNEMRVSTEDLNKKFDEFIRKMKEEIRTEARQQYLIVV